MLGPLQMDIDRCITEYLSLAPIVFPEKNFVRKSKLAKVFKLVQGNALFDPKPMERQIKALVKKEMGARATDGADTLLWGSGTSECKVSAFFKYLPPRHLIDKFRVLCCAAVEPLTPIRLGTYMAPHHSRTIKPKIWQACLATSAAPTLFPPISFGNPRREFVDGGLGQNNPIRMLLDEVSQLWPKRAIGCLVSIGAGRKPSADVGKKIMGLFKTVVDISTDTETVAAQVAGEMSSKYGIHQSIYHRFNVDSGLESVDLAEWKDFARVTNCTEAYLVKQRDSVQICVSQLRDPKRM
jgi:hypothetical protein